VHIPPSPLDTQQVVRTLAASRKGTHAVVHVEGLSCLVLDIAAACKSDAEISIWQDAMPGACQHMTMLACLWRCQRNERGSCHQNKSCSCHRYREAYKRMHVDARECQGIHCNTPPMSHAECESLCTALPTAAPASALRPSGHTSLASASHILSCPIIDQPRASCCAGFHTQSILCISAATRRPLIASASKDNTVRIWDYRRQVCITCYQATHPITSLSLHPWGTEMVIASRERAHAYVIANELICGQRLESSQGGFSRCAFSPRGGLLACTRKASILIYITNTYQLAATLHGHPDEVLDLQWSADGIRLVSVCHAAVYTWSMETYTKVEEDTARAHINACAAVDSAATRVVVADVNGGLRVFATSRAACGEPARPHVAAGAGVGEIAALCLLSKCAAILLSCLFLFFELACLCSHTDKSQAPLSGGAYFSALHCGFSCVLLQQSRWMSTSGLS
jgi:WD40 repeat protein